tara:strand:+ start:17038 stop:17298 length:261 start_codon:yes stop_codon:yes gene_type:complete
MAEERNNGCDHYKKNPIQPWDIIDAYQLDFYAGNVIKYLLRNAPGNNAPKHRIDEYILEDLQKAQHYLAKMIEDRAGSQGECNEEV